MDVPVAALATRPWNKVLGPAEAAQEAAQATWAVHHHPGMGQRFLTRTQLVEEVLSWYICTMTLVGFIL